MRWKNLCIGRACAMRLLALCLKALVCLVSFSVAVSVSSSVEAQSTSSDGSAGAKGGRGSGGKRAKAKKRKKRGKKKRKRKRKKRSKVNKTGAWFLRFEPGVTNIALSDAAFWGGGALGLRLEPFSIGLGVYGTSTGELSSSLVLDPTTGTSFTFADASQRTFLSMYYIGGLITLHKLGGEHFELDLFVGGGQACLSLQQSGPCVGTVGAFVLEPRIINTFAIVKRRLDIYWGLAARVMIFGQDDWDGRYTMDQFSTWGGSLFVGLRYSTEGLNAL